MELVESVAEATVGDDADLALANKRGVDKVC